MEIFKGEKVYTVLESVKKWTVKLENGKLGVSFEISKELCTTEDELRAYVLKNDMF